MNKKFTMIILVAPILVVASRLIVIPTQDAAALIAQGRGIDIRAGPVGVRVGSDGIGINVGSSNDE